MKKFKKIKGVILTEALISVAMLIIASVATTTVITNSVNATKLSKNYLIAENYLTEAIEVTETVRNSNWLIRPHATDACWLVPDPELLLNINSPCILVSINSKYKIKFDSDHWRLEKVANDNFSLDPNPLFERKIIFSEINSSSATFEVIVSWTDGAKPFSISRKHILYNYK